MIRSKQRRKRSSRVPRGLDEIEERIAGVDIKTKKNEKGGEEKRRNEKPFKRFVYWIIVDETFRGTCEPMAFKEHMWHVIVCCFK